MSLKLISKYRTCLMALAMIWIGFNHSYFPFTSKLMGFFVKCGYGGVDVFVFLSGFGLYYSLKKNPTYKEYIKRRFLRIFPYNMPIALIGDILYKEELLVSIFDVFGLSLLIRSNLLFWFSSFIIIMYLIYPLYYFLFIKKPYIVTSLFMIVVVTICLHYRTINYQVSYVAYRIIAICLGTLFAYLNDRDLVKPKYCWLFILLMLIGWIIMYFIYHNFGSDIQHVAPLALITPGIILFVAWLIDKISLLQKPLNYIGQYTFQFYLIHEKLILVFNTYYSQLYIPGIGFDWWINIIAFVGAFILAILYKKLIDKIMSVIMNKTKGAS